MPAEVMDGFLDAKLCDELIARAEGLGFGATRALYPEDYRNNDRLVLDSPELAAQLFARFKARVPGTAAVGFNSRFRFCRYSAGQKFTIHRDGAHVRENGERSRLTFQVYLNDNFAGGHTRFFTDKVGSALVQSVQPLSGRAILFPHDDWHDGEAVPQGTKYVMRTDLMFAQEAMPPGHTGYVWKVLHRDGVVYSASRDGTVRAKDKSVRGPGGSIVSLAFNNEQLMGATRSGAIFTADVEQGTWHAIAQVDAAVLDLLFLGGYVAACADGTIRIPSAVAHAHEGWVTGLAHLPRRDLIASVGHDGMLVISRASDLSFVARYRHMRPLTSVSANDWEIVLGDNEGQLVVLKFGCDNFTQMHSVKAHDGAITCLARRGDLVASGGEDNRVRICNVHQPARVIAQNEHADFVRSIAWTSDTTCVSGGYDALLRFTQVL